MAMPSLTPVSPAIPPLTPDELAQLESNIMLEGCREPLVLWRGTLLDGHNRLTICQKHDLPFATMSVELPDRAAALDFIYRNQLGRRNLNPDQFRVLLGRRYLEQKQTGWKTRSGQSDQNDTTDALIAALEAEGGTANEVDSVPQEAGWCPTSTSATCSTCCRRWRPGPSTAS